MLVVMVDVFGELLSVVDVDVAAAAAAAAVRQNAMLLFFSTIIGSDENL